MRRELYCFILLFYVPGFVLEALGVPVLSVVFGAQPGDGLQENRRDRIVLDFAESKQLVEIYGLLGEPIRVHQLRCLDVVFYREGLEVVSCYGPLELLISLGLDSSDFFQHLPRRGDEPLFCDLEGFHVVRRVLAELIL